MHLWPWILGYVLALFLFNGIKGRTTIGQLLIVLGTAPVLFIEHKFLGSFSFILAALFTSALGLYSAWTLHEPHSWVKMLLSEFSRRRVALAEEHEHSHRSERLDKLRRELEQTNTRRRELITAIQALEGEIEVERQSVFRNADRQSLS